MPADLDALKRRFWASVDYFNAGDFTKANFPSYGLDNNIAMKKIDDPQEYYDGIASVRNYFLTTGKAEHAWLNPGSQPDFQVVGQLGFVSGTAEWVDKTIPSPTPRRRIAYSITYTSVSGEWKAIHMWGTFI